MKVLMVSKSQVVGAYRGKLKEMARLGVELTVITPPRWGRQQFEATETDGYKLLVLPCVLSGYTHFHFYTHLPGLIEADLVYLEEEPWSLVTYQFMRRCVKEQKPAIFFTWQNIDKDYPPPFASFEKFAFAHADACIAGSEDASHLLARRGFHKPVAVIPQFGVDPEHFKKRDVSSLRAQLRLDGKFVLGYVGRLVEAKGIRDLIEALALLPEECVLVLVGDGDFQAGARKLVLKLGLSSRVRWVSHVPSLQVPEYMSLFDVLVLPSRTTPQWKEQFGRVLIEAMACETVPVGSSSGEIPNVIGDTGLVFAEGDVTDLAERLMSLHMNHDEIGALARKGRARVLQNFTHRKIAEDIVAFYSLVLRGRTGPLEAALVRK